MGISSQGIGSNLDINSLVTGLMAVEQRPLTLVQNQQASIQTKLTAFGQLQSAISSFGDAAKALTKSDTISTFTTVVADTSIATAIATSKAAAGTYTLEVTRLAKNDKLIGPPVANASAQIGSGALTITLGSNDTSTGTFTADPSKTAVTIPIATGKSTLADIRDAINQANAGVTASIVNDGTGSRLIFSGTNTGANSAIKISVADDDGDNANAAGLSAMSFDPASGGTQNLSKVQSAQDAAFIFDTINITSPTNQVTGAIDGLTLNLASAKPGVPTTLTVSPNSQSANQAIATFVTAYNNLNKLAGDLTKYDATTKKSGTLQGDSTAIGAVARLRSLLTGSLGGSGSYSRLSDIGLELQSNGSLKLNQTKFDTAASAGLSKVAALFTTAGTNPDTFGTRIASLVDSLDGTDGLLVSKTDGLNRTIASLIKQQDTINLRLTATEARLRAQFTALDTKMSSLTATSTYLTSQFNALYNNTKTSN